MTDIICRMNECKRVAKTRGLCGPHYEKARRAGLPPLPSPDRSLQATFWPRVDKTGDCWVWLGTKTSEGYGTIGQDGRTRLTHRVAYEALMGPIPAGVMLDHRCHNRACVNPDHLQPVTNKLNQENRRGLAANNTSGVRGVSWIPARQRWRVTVRHNGRLHYGGSFRTLEDAEHAAIALRNRLHTNNLRDKGVTL